MKMLGMTEPKENSDSKTKTKEEALRSSAELFGVDGNNLDVENEFVYEINIPKDSKDNILRISRMIKVALLKLSGYEEEPTSDGKKQRYKLVRQPFASSEVLKSFESILSPYSDESNIVTKKQWDSFKVQALADWGAFYKFCLRDKAQSDRHLRTVYRVFQDCVINIGEITCDNPDNMKHLFGSMKEGGYDYKEDNPFNK